jgi:sugar phosphate isomerase/epimerase
MKVNAMDKPIYGMPTNPSRDLLVEISQAGHMGFDFVEIGMEPPGGHFDVFMRKNGPIMSGLKRFHHPPVAHTAYWYELWSEYDEIRHSWINVVKRNIDIASCLGCRKLNIHAPLQHGTYGQSRIHWNRALGNYIKSMDEIVQYASDRGMVIMMENMGPFGAPFDDYSKIMESVPGLRAHIDVGHAFLEGGMPMVRKHIRTFRKRLEHFHFTDNLGLSDDHMGIGQGIIDYFKVMELLRKVKYSKTVGLEVFTSRKDMKNSLSIIREIQEEVWSR